MRQAGENNGLYQNLLDAGCTAEAASRYAKLAEEGAWNRLLRALAEQKKYLLSALHRSEKQIDCLDFLVYEINKNHKGEL